MCIKALAWRRAFCAFWMRSGSAVDWRKGFQFSKGDSLGFWKGFPRFSTLVLCEGSTQQLWTASFAVLEETESMFCIDRTVDYKLGLNLQLSALSRICILCFLYVSLLPFVACSIEDPPSWTQSWLRRWLRKTTLCHLSSISPALILPH